MLCRLHLTNISTKAAKSDENNLSHNAVNEKNQNMADDHQYFDWIQMHDLPKTISTKILRSIIRYRVAGPRIIAFDVFTVIEENLRSIFHTEWVEPFLSASEVKEKLLRLTLADNLIYKEDKILGIIADLHSESLLVRVSIIDYKNPSIILLQKDHLLPLVSPLRRPNKRLKHSCISWIAYLRRNISMNMIEKCPKINNVVELLSYPVALIGDEFPYRKFLSKIDESQGLFADHAQFTLATWLYLTKRCSKDMCPLLYRMKGTGFETPLIGLLQSGHLHLQFHYADGNAYAFLADAQVPIHQWVHIAVTVKNTVVKVYVRHGKKLQHMKSFVHTDFPSGAFYYNDMEGYWGVGGSSGFTSTNGFIGPAKIYRRSVLSEAAIKSIFTVLSRPDLRFNEHFKLCRQIRSFVKQIKRKESEHLGYCSTKKFFISTKKYSCDKGGSGIISEIYQVLSSSTQNSSIFVPQKLYNIAFNLTKSDKNTKRDMIPLLLSSSCAGHQKSLYLLALLYRIGLGLDVNTMLAQTYLLLGAYYNHPLSQMSLAYKHYIGVDGIPKDHDVAVTYYRYSAVQSNRMLNEHNEVDTHAEAVRLDKKEDLDSYRGPNSNWFTWLKHQAKRGAIDAQSALGEVFYYGSRGFRRNLTKAAEFYEMGANRGDAQMLFNLGVVHLRGQGVPVDTNKAQQLLQQSADLGFAPAYNALGYYELNVRQNNSGAVEYFKHAAQMEDRDGLYNFGFAVENGLAPNTVGDIKSAMNHYISAANKGHIGACVVVGDAFALGEHVERNYKISFIFYKFVADQNPEVGFFLRNGLDGYFESLWYPSMLNYLLAAEAGVEIAQYNTALLCEWNDLSKETQIDCANRYYNHSANLQWVPSLIKTADNHWYGVYEVKNTTAAAHLYNLAANKEQNPQAIYNLGYIVENNYSLHGLDWIEFHFKNVNPGNLTVAAAVYRKCRDSSDEAFLPCSLGLLRVTIKKILQLQLFREEILLIPLTLFLFVIAVLNYLA